MLSRLRQSVEPPPKRASLHILLETPESTPWTETREEEGGGSKDKVKKIKRRAELLGLQVLDIKKGKSISADVDGGARTWP